MPSIHTRLIKFDATGPTTPDQFRAVEQQLRAQIEVGGVDKVVDLVWTTGDFDVVSTIVAAGDAPKAALAGQAPPGVERSIDLVHRPL